MTSNGISGRHPPFPACEPLRDTCETEFDAFRGAGVVEPVRRVPGYTLQSSPSRWHAEEVEAGIPGSGIGVGVPGLLHHPQGCLRQDGTKPARDVHAHVIHLVGVLPRATRTICVGPVLQDLHAAALSIGLISAFLLWGKITWMFGQRTLRETRGSED